MRFIPNFKGYDFFPHDLRLPFMRYKGICLALSIVGMALSLIIGVKGFNYGVDFKGGSMIEVRSTSGPADIAALREKLGKLGLGAVQIQSFGKPTDVLIRVELQPGGEAAQQEALKEVTDSGFGVALVWFAAIALVLYGLFCIISAPRQRLKSAD